jgi:hypothetical protein
MQVVSDVVLDVTAHVAGQALAAKEYVIGPVAGGIGFGKYLAAGTVPVIAARGFLDAPAISIIGIGDAAGWPILYGFSL